MIAPNAVTISEMASRRRFGTPVASAVLRGSMTSPELRYGGSVASPICNGGGSVSGSELARINRACQLLSGMIFEVEGYEYIRLSEYQKV